MKRSGLLQLLFLLLPLLGVAQNEINFIHDNWKQTVADAQKNGKRVFIDAYTTWCGPCKWMAKNTFTDPSVVEYMNKNFVCLKIDIESEDGQTFVAEHPVQAIPTLFFIDEKGTILHNEAGALDVSDFMPLAVSMSNGGDAMHPVNAEPLPDPKEEAYKALDESYKAGDRSRSLLAKYMTMEIELKKKDNIAEVAEALVAKARPSEMVNDTIFTAFCLADLDLQHPFNTHFIEKYESYQMLYEERAQNKGNAIIARAAAIAASHKNKKEFDRFQPFYRRMVPADSKRQVRKLFAGIYANALKEK